MITAFSLTLSSPSGRGSYLLVFLAVAGAGCQRQTCNPAQKSVVEVRDAAGALELALRPVEPSRLELCDGTERRVGYLVSGTEQLTLSDVAGNLLVRYSRSPEAGGAAVEYPTARHRIYDDGKGMARLLDPEGIPVAELGEDAENRRALAYDPSGSPLAWAKRAGILDERRVVYQRDGTVSNYVIGVSRDRAAAAIGLPMLPLPERLALARWLDR